MGSLIREIRHPEISALLEWLDGGNVNQAHLKRLRKEGHNEHLTQAIMSLLQVGHPDDLMFCEHEPSCPEGYRVCGPKWRTYAHNGWRWNAEEFLAGLVSPFDDKRYDWFAELQTRPTTISEVVNETCRLKELCGSSAHVLDLLMVNPGLIPLEVKAFQVIFPTTAYYDEHTRSKERDLYRSLVWKQGEWKDEFIGSGRKFDSTRHRISTYPSASLAG